MESFVISYVQKQKKAFFDNFEGAVENLKVDPVHDLRVSVKRLKAITRMFEYDKNSIFNFKHALSPINNLYKGLGSIRDLQVLNNVTKEYQKSTGIDLSELTDFLSKETKTAIDKFNKNKGKINRDLLLATYNEITYSISSFNQEYIKTVIIQYRENLGQRYLKYANNKHKKYDLHKARKMVKDISYLMEMAGKEIGGFADSFKHYKNLGSKLGKWHDLDIYFHQLQTESLSKNISDKKLNNLLKKVDHDRKNAENELSYSL